jgi:hypothetical protein
MTPLLLHHRRRRSGAIGALSVLLLWWIAPTLDAFELTCQPEGVVTSIAGSGANGFRVS